MRAVSAAELLDVWERGLAQSPSRRMLTLLAAACPEDNAAEIAALPVGRRNGLLLELRERLFGPQLAMVAACPACGERLESTFPVADLRSDLDSDTPAAHCCEIGGYRLTFRLPTSLDLLALSGTMAREPARLLLLGRCVLAVSATGETTPTDSLPEHVVAAVCEQMARSDPQADVELSLSCPACRCVWQTPFDIASFLWQEIHAWAKPMLRAVHGLARAYGWREADILALSPTRRQIYLELARQ